jgi:membrane associated rhomboid family serine protease
MSYQFRRSRDDLTPIWIIAGANVVVFLLTMIVPGTVMLLGLQPATVLDKPWTLVTTMFTHASFWHIFTNMFTLYFFGTFVSQLVGSRYMLYIYFGGGILGSIFFVLLGSPFSVAIGASGAIFALGGTLAVLRPKTRVVAFPIPIPMPLWVAIVFGFLIMSFLPGIAWQAHLGGLIGGAIAGYFLRKKARLVLF